ncbi:hypothetical protein DMW56_27870, partial [Serratia marcescens]|uniref:LPXTG cell wall anchor domain-containing protein n=1 Tax=Serratia marcescens TaxID=615 RepID=UPI000D85DA56
LLKTGIGRTCSRTDTNSPADYRRDNDGSEPHDGVEGNNLERYCDEGIAEHEYNTDTSVQSNHDVESRGASHNINHGVHANHQEESRDKLTINSNTHNLSVVSTKSSSHHAVTTNHGSVVSDKSNHANTSSDNVKKELPKSGQTETNTTLWSVLLGGLGLAFVRKRKTSKSEK